MRPNLSAPARWSRWAAALALLGWLLAGTTTRAATVTTPRQFLGANLGDDYFLANYRQLTNYWIRLAHESPRLRLFPLGATAEGRLQIMGVVTSPANHRRLDHYRALARDLATAAVPAAAADALAREGKAVVWIDGGLHASEVLGAQQLMETLYQMVAGDDAETRRILDEVIILFIPANPDGMDLCSDWYMRNPDPQKRTLAGLPRLYQKYIGHDNNRDFYAATQPETRNLNRVMYHEWFPQIVYNHHQTGPPGTVIFCPPFRDPFNYNVDPLVISGVDALGAAMMQRFLAEDKPGATVRSGTRYSTWWNGGLRTTCYFHNMIGLLTEAVGSPTPIQIPLVPALQLPRADYLAPIAPQTWHFRQSIDYSVSANKAVLDYAARQRQPLLHDIWLMGRNAIDRGNRDSWTITPKMVNAAKTNRASANEFPAYFRDPARRDPRGYIISADQPDFPTATKFANALLDTGVTVQRATAEFVVGGVAYPAGSLVVPAAQPFRAHVLDQFEPQDHPDDFPYPGAPPTPPYDLAGWTLAYQMGVHFDRVLHGFNGPFVNVSGPLSAPRAEAAAPEEAPAGWVLDPRPNDTYRIVNRLLAAGIPVSRLTAPWSAESVTRPAGAFFVPFGPAARLQSPVLAREFGVKFTGVTTAPDPGSIAPLHPLRIGLWDRYGGSIPSGWTRWLLEQFEFPFRLVYAPELNRGGLREHFDALIFVDGSLPAPAGSPRRAAADEGGDAAPPPAAEPATDSAATNAPALSNGDPYREQRGSLTTRQTIPQLRAFLEAGGTIVTIGSATSLAYHLGLPVTNALVAPDADGRPRPLARTQFYIPGSLLQARLDSAQPLAWGLPDHADFMFTATTPAFRLLPGAETNGVARVAWYDSTSPLRSGWAWGQDHLADATAIAEARVGAGRLALFTPEILFRGQSHGTFKLLFNALLNDAPR